MSKGERTRERILTFALATACRHGLLGLHLLPLAERAGLTKSGLYAHFRSQAALQLATLAEAERRFAASIVAPAKEDGAGVPRLEGLLRRWLAWPASAGFVGECPFLRAATEAAALTPAVRAHLAARLAGFRALLEAEVAAAVRRGQLAPDTEPAQLAHAFLALRHGHELAHGVLGDAAAAPRTLAAFRAVVRHRARADDGPPVPGARPGLG